ncbi:unnamed protein product [Pedinophyceae sp. YPF-701]|nr:unnamed protein product [Pedinophyceae sp. YPF-701]
MASELEDNVFFKYVAPSMGATLAAIMFLSPLKAVLRVRREASLGDLNPLPFAAIVFNCSAWIGYSIVQRDWYIWTCNVWGLSLGMFYTLSGYKLAGGRLSLRLPTQGLIEGIMVSLGAVIALLAWLSVKAGMNDDHRQLLWGFAANAILLVYYSAPLSTVAQVIKTRNAASLYWPLSLTNGLNGLMWTAYGVSLQDYFIWIPNGIGVVLSLFQLLLIAVFPSDGRPKRWVTIMIRRGRGGGDSDSEGAKALQSGSTTARDGVRGLAARDEVATIATGHELQETLRDDAA